MKILCTGDIHIGRRPSKVPQGRAAEWSAARMWDAIVERAIQERVDLLALTGDIVDRDNRFFEAFGPLERGIKRLAGAGIRTFAVAGNHDYDVLPRLVASVGGESFRLLGANGDWETEIVNDADGRPALAMQGWSFPREQWRTSPLEQFEAPQSNLPVVALLHCDLGQPESKYAPVMRGELRGREVSIWLLGHVHRPLLEIDPPGGAAILYPGSPQALDPGEIGVHGPWLIEINRGGRAAARQLPMSRVRYDSKPLDIVGLTTIEEVQARIATRLKELVVAAADEGEGYLEWLSVRLRLEGRTPLDRALRCRDLAELAKELELERGGIDEVAIETRPAVDLLEMSRSQDPPGTVARLLMALESEDLDPLAAGLVTEAARRIEAVYRSAAYRCLTRVESSDREGGDADRLPDRDDARRMAIAQGRLLLDTLLAQKESPA